MSRDERGPLALGAAAVPLLVRTAARFGLGGAVGATIVVLSIFDGGYAPAAWGWTSLLAFWICTLVLAFRSEQVVDHGAVALVGGFVAVGVWTALSATWSRSVPRTMLELERDLVYVALATAVLLLCNSAGRWQLMWGLCAGLVVVAALALVVYLASTPKFDATQGYLLFHPVGYANALGGLMALAVPLLVAFAAYDPRRAVRSVSGASVVVSTVALFLTQNRAGFVALGVALVVWLSRTDAPARALAATLELAVPVGVALLTIKLLGLFDTHRQVADLAWRRVGAGGVVAFAVVVSAFGAARLRRLRLPHARVAYRAQIGAGAAVALAGLAFCLALMGAGNRAQYWRVAWHSFERHLLLGTGAGTFDEQWLRYRGTGLSVQDAHSLYLETLSELGVVGLLLLLALLAIPIVVSRRTRDPLTTACLAAYCAFLVHAGFEWDWEMPVVIVSGLVLASVLVRSRAGAIAFPLPRFGRFAGAAVAALLAAFALVALVGNSDLVAAERQIARGDLGAATVQATRAKRLLPWSSEPWLVIADVRSRSLDAAGSRAALRQAIARDGADWSLWFRLAAVSHGNERAVALRRAVALNPGLLARAVSGS
jgi:O-antigen ligase